ncbi:MAG: ATP-binding cassette domain-containing protein [Gammaproteobacteria bacterium]|nr:ATP-binding cassette domain-containing protein [Gammaproteobacteria bacterium]MCW8841671.1 ATP-binding cassette domain-containing protein [Gammaproteobacteria bacterium]MCW8958119.1 ATP-binding cassette domain-containing protein [Gammaproteobacteria bacterium]MCW8973700.1 ATP-binding cassette domain-containing protein [Gammaproteobacteria bacterium]MCW8993564.1 ATP-binding cassette domain-containing protein [Gammaproteobacteria bacterium]
MNSAGPVVTVSGLCKRYGGQTVVDAVDLEVRAGECFGLLGPNGAGKTTVLRMLMGMTPPDGGEIKVLGYPVPQQARQMRQQMGVVPQQDSLDPDFTVVENLRTYASYFGISRAELGSRIGRLLDFASLQHKADARIDALSGGMKRRLTMARALVNDPQLVILDEPTTGLDPQARQLIWQRLRALLSQGRTLILTTHYMDEAQRLCDRLAIMDNGRILDIDSPDGLIRRHIESHVVEVHGPGLARWLAEGDKPGVVRSEQVGETLFCYTENERALVDDLCEHDDLMYLSRAANLEDVFLKLTGRELRE